MDAQHEDEAWPGLPPPSAGAADFAARLREAPLPPEDLLCVARAVEAAGVRVLLPPRPRDLGLAGSLHVAGRRCGKRTCHCARPGGRLHGPYVWHCWREGARQRRRSLGRLGRARAPADMARPLRDELAALNAQRRRDGPAFDLTFLHDG